VAIPASENTTSPVKRWLAALWPAIVFVVLCCGVLPYPGVQQDEALFTVPLYSEVAHEMKIRVFHRDIPLMLLSYLGTAKTWLYAPLFHYWRPSLISLRLPAIAIGALTLWALYELMSLIAGRLPALAACWLLATDATFVLTTAFDWGPVAIQHLTLVAGMLFVYRGFQRKSAAGIGAGFLLFGLGMWDKAIFIWVLSGAALATAILFTSALRSTLTRRNLTAAAAGLVLGAAPLILYNIRNPLETFHGTAVFSATEVPLKFEIAKRTLAGSVLFGYLVGEESSPNPKPPSNTVERASVGLREWVGNCRSSLLPYAFAGAVLAAPLWWPRRKLVFFALIVILVAWLQMAFTKDTGSGAHHVVLLWPFPHIVAAVALAGLMEGRWRGSMFIGSGIAAALCVSSLLVYNQYLCQFIRNGTTNYWTDAILPLSTKLVSFEDRPLFVSDWGIDYALRMLFQGRLKQLWTANDVVSHELTAADRSMLARMFLLKGAYFITHTPAFEIQAGSRNRLFSTAQSLGYQPHRIATIDDSNRRHVFELVEFVSGADGPLRRETPGVPVR
jgi:hypothetical protein